LNEFKNQYCDEYESLLVDCLIKFQCMVRDDYYDAQAFIDLYNFENTCGYTMCKDSMALYIDCLCARTRDDLKFDQCMFYPRTCKIIPYLVPQWILATIVVGVLLLVAVVSYVGYLIYKKKYYSILSCTSYCF